MSIVIKSSKDSIYAVEEFNLTNFSGPKQDTLSSEQLTKHNFSIASLSDDMDVTASRVHEFLPDITGEIKTDADRKREIDKKYVQEAEKKAEQIKKEAYKEGISQGLALLAPSVDAFRNISMEMNRLRDDFYTNIEKEMISLILSLSKSVINHEVETNKDMISSTLKRAVQLIKDQEDITVKVHPADLEYAKKTKDDLQEITAGVPSIKIVANPSVSRGGCSVSSNFVNIGFDIAETVKSIENAFKKTLDAPLSES